MLSTGQVSTWQQVSEARPPSLWQTGTAATPHAFSSASPKPSFCKLSISHCYSAPPHQTSGWQLFTNCHQPPAAQHLLSAARKRTLKERVFKTPSVSAMASTHETPPALLYHVLTASGPGTEQHRNVPPQGTMSIQHRRLDSEVVMGGRPCRKVERHEGEGRSSGSGTNMGRVTIQR